MWFFEVIKIRSKKKLRHDTDNIARSIVLSRCLVGHFREFPKKLFKDMSHLVIIYLRWMEVYLIEFLDNMKEKTSSFEPFELLIEIKLFKNVTNILTVPIDVLTEIFPE